MSGDCKVKKIGTHNGTFHCDEVLACFMLKQLPQYKNAEIVRTRDPAVLETCDIVVDVGGVFDPSKHRYDHHQRTFSDTMSSLSEGKKWVTKLSSAGLIYLYFGRDIVSQVLETEKKDPLTETIYDKMYENFVEEIDGIDNGVDQFDGTPRYKITTTVSSQVGSLNPAWNEKGVDVQERFNDAMKLVGTMFMNKIKHYKNSWVPARDIVEKAINSRLEVDSSGEIIKLSEGGCPWKDHLFTLEKELGITPPIKYVLYTDQSGKWRIQCVPVSITSFQNRNSTLTMDKGSEDFTCEPCKVDGRLIEAEGYCLDCEDYLCISCLEIHLRPKPLRHHRLISIEEKLGGTSVDAGFEYSDNSETTSDEETEDSEDGDEEPDQSNAEKPDYCEKHKDKIIEYFCENHKVLGCSVCMTLDHRLCKIIYVDRDLKTVEDIPVYKTFEKEVENALKTLTDTKAEATSKRNEIQSKAGRAVGQITKLRSELVSIIDKSQRALLDEVKKTKTLQTKLADEKLKSISEMEHTLSILVSELADKCENTSKSTQLFLAVAGSSEKLQKYKEQLKGVEVKPIVVSEYKFEQSNSVKPFIADKSIGSLTTKIDTVHQELKLISKSSNEGSAKSEPKTSQSEKAVSGVTAATFPPANQSAVKEPEKSASTKPLESISGQYITEINVSSVTDNSKCSVTGMTMLDNQRLALCDFQNSCMKIIDVANLKFSLKIKLESQPYEAAFSGKELYITMPNKASLAIFTDTKDFKTFKYLAVGNECRGIVCHDEKIYISFNKNPGKIQVRKPNGEILRTFTSCGGDTFHHPSHLALHPLLPKLYVSDWQICTLGLDGSLVRKHRDLGFRELRGLSITVDGNLFVCDRESDAIYLIIPMVERRQVFLDSNNGIKKPLTLLVTGKTKKKLFVAMETCDAIKVFQISNK